MASSVFRRLVVYFGRYVLGGRVRFLNGTQGVIGFDRLDNINELPTLG